MPWNQWACSCARVSGRSAPVKTGTSELQISAVRSAFRVACSRPTLPATVVRPSTRTSGAASAIMIATASSEAVSVSMRKLRMAPASRARSRSALGSKEIGENDAGDMGLAWPVAAELRDRVRDVGNAPMIEDVPVGNGQFGGPCKILRWENATFTLGTDRQEGDDGIVALGAYPAPQRRRRPVTAKLHWLTSRQRDCIGPQVRDVGEGLAVNLLTDRAMAEKPADRFSVHGKARSAARAGAVLVQGSPPLSRALTPSPEARETPVKVRLQVLDVLEADAEAHRRAAGREARRGASGCAVEGNGESFS